MVNGTVTPGNVETDIIASTAGGASGMMECVVDLSNMQAGDTVVFRVYRWLNGAWVFGDDETLTGAQTYKFWEASGMYVNATMRGRLTIQQTAGPSRSFWYETEVAG